MNGGMILCPSCKQHAGRVIVERRQVGHGDFVNFAHVECACGAVGPETEDWFNTKFEKDAKALFKAGARGGE